MATISLRMRDDLKRKAQQLAKEQGVSLNGFINATIAAAVAQQESAVEDGDDRFVARHHFTVYVDQDIVVAWITDKIVSSHE